MHDTPTFVSFCWEFLVQIARCLNFLWKTTSLYESSIYMKLQSPDECRMGETAKKLGIIFDMLSQGGQGLTPLSVTGRNRAFLYLATSDISDLFSTITKPAVHTSNYHLTQLPCPTICRFQKDIGYLLESFWTRTLLHTTDHRPSKIFFGCPRNVLQSGVQFGQHEQLWF